MDRVKRRDSGTRAWVEEDFSEANMAWIEAIYDKLRSDCFLIAGSRAGADEVVIEWVEG